MGILGGITTPTAAMSSPEWFCIQMDSGVSHFNAK